MGVFRPFWCLFWAELGKDKVYNYAGLLPTRDVQERKKHPPSYSIFFFKNKVVGGISGCQAK